MVSGPVAGADAREFAIDGALAELGVTRIHDRFGDPLRFP